MKKPTVKTTKLRKLGLRAEAIALLTPPQLGEVRGGWTWDWPCGGTSNQATCATTVI
jgi:hypothetical protein